MDTTNLVISGSTLLALLGFIKPLFDSRKELEGRLVRLENDLKHLEASQDLQDKQFEKLGDKLEALENKLQNISNSITRIETLLNQRNIP